MSSLLFSFLSVQFSRGRPFLLLLSGVHLSAKFQYGTLTLGTLESLYIVYGAVIRPAPGWEPSPSFCGSVVL